MFGARSASSGVGKREMDQRGIIPRCAELLFESIRQMNTNQGSATVEEVTISASFLEIYLEVIRDLLNPGAKDLKIRETAMGGLMYHSFTSG